MFLHGVKYLITIAAKNRYGCVASATGKFWMYK
jgi:hypothetical protein